MHCYDFMMRSTRRDTWFELGKASCWYLYRALCLSLLTQSEVRQTLQVLLAVSNIIAWTLSLRNLSKLFNQLLSSGFFTSDFLNPDFSPFILFSTYMKLLQIRLMLQGNQMLQGNVNRTIWTLIYPKRSQHRKIFLATPYFSELMALSIYIFLILKFISKIQDFQVALHAAEAS